MMDLELLIKNGVQFGHQAWRVCPKMKPYIWGEKNGIHLIDVSKTAQRIEKASQFLEEVAARGEPILWVGTKKAAQPVIEQIGQQLSAPYVSNRWIGGTLTNFSEVKKAILKLKHYESLLEHSEKQYTKKEYGKFRKIVERVEENVGGIRNISWPIGALVVVDAKKEQVAVKEAIKMGIPVVALTDTNTDPSGIDFVIPANDDIARSVRTVIDPLVEAVARGVQQAEKVAYQQQQKAEQQEQEKASTQEAEAAEKQEVEQEQPQSEEKQQEKTKQTQTAKKTAQSTQEVSQEQASEQADDEQKQQKKATTQKSTKSSSSATTKKSTSKSSTAAKSSTSSTSSSKKTATKASTSAKSTTRTSKKAEASTTAEKTESAATGEDEPVEGDSSQE